MRSETFRLNEIDKVAKRLLKRFQPGDVIAFSAELAGGKTTLIKAIVAHMGYAGAVSSPTFTIERRYPVSYDGIEEVIHLDFYRLGGKDLTHIDWSEYLEQPQKLVLVEWPERAESYLPPHTKTITIEVLDEKTRRLQLPDSLS